MNILQLPLKMLESSFLRTQFSRYPGRHILITFVGFCLWLAFGPTPLIANVDAPKEMLVLLRGFILMGRIKQQFVGHLKLESVEKAIRNFARLISGIREVFGIADQVQTAK